ncbi:flavodoxin-dependent (E)-4-hydroxy-3-methylbut-2-enyl-diphosphate synthase [Chlamydiota bacterium]
MIKPRKKTRIVTIGTVAIGGDNPIAIQSMTNTYTGDIPKTVKQIKRLEQVGCELVRVAVPDTPSLEALKTIKKQISIPLIADIHFRPEYALVALKNGIDKIRLNPGTLSPSPVLDDVIKAAMDTNTPIRLGINAGSIPKDILKTYKKPTDEALLKSIARFIEFFLERDFENLVVSLKSFDIETTVNSYKMFSEDYDFPVHVGITESGPVPHGIVRSALGIGQVLQEGIGDTIRVSLTAPPEEEVIVGYEILQALKIRRSGPVIISCPTCARTSWDVIKTVKSVQKKIKTMSVPLKIAIMGCEVNGPGEARIADIGITAGRGRYAMLFKKGKIVKKVPKDKIIDTLLDEILTYDMEWKNKKRL